MDSGRKMRGGAGLSVVLFRRRGRRRASPARSLIKMPQNRVSVSHSALHVLVGRLVTDRAFRGRVEHGGSAYIAALRFQGVALTRSELVRLVVSTPRTADESTARPAPTS